MVNQKFFEELSSENAGPSTAFVAKNAPNFAQDDSVFYLANFRLRRLDEVPEEFLARRGNHAPSHEHTLFRGCF
jgi:hypothetical protein